MPALKPKAAVRAARAKGGPGALDWVGDVLSGKQKPLWQRHRRTQRKQWGNKKRLLLRPMLPSP